MKTKLPFADRAACRSLDPTFFFVERGHNPTQEAIDACAHCPVRNECLDWALHHEQLGYWGGTSEKQRRRLRQSLHISVAAPVVMSGVWSEWYNSEKVRV